MTLDDLGGDVQSVEEVDLGWIQTSWASGNCVVDWGESTDSGFGWDLVGFNLLFKNVDWSITEDKGDLILEDWGEDLKFRDFSSVLFKISEFFFLNTFSSEFDDFFDQGLNKEVNLRSWQ